MPLLGGTTGLFRAAGGLLAGCVEGCCITSGGFKRANACGGDSACAGAVFVPVDLVGTGFSFSLVGFNCCYFVSPATTTVFSVPVGATVYSPANHRFEQCARCRQCCVAPFVIQFNDRYRPAIIRCNLSLPPAGCFNQGASQSSIWPNVDGAIDLDYTGVGPLPGGIFAGYFGLANLGSITIRVFSGNGCSAGLVEDTYSGPNLLEVAINLRNGCGTILQAPFVSAGEVRGSVRLILRRPFGNPLSQNRLIASLAGVGPVPLVSGMTIPMPGLGEYSPNGSATLLFSADTLCETVTL